MRIMLIRNDNLCLLRPCFNNRSTSQECDLAIMMILSELKFMFAIITVSGFLRSSHILLLKWRSK